MFQLKEGDADAVAEAQQEERITPEEVAIPEVLPLLPIRDKVYFPHSLVYAIWKPFGGILQVLWCHEHWNSTTLY